MLVNSTVKALTKKRRHTTAQNLLVSLSKTSMVKRQALWYSSFITAYVWFLYWIAQDFFVWNKPVFEVNAVNYAGAITAMAFIWAGTKLLKPDQTKTSSTPQNLTPPTQQPPPPIQKPAPQTTQPKPRKTVEAPTISGCTHHLGYLNQRDKSQAIPAECLTCEHVIQCMGSQN